MADQVTSRGKGLSMPDNPARALQEMMLAQMDDDASAPAVPDVTAPDAESPPPSEEKKSKTVRQIDGKNERQKVSNTTYEKDSQAESKTAREPEGMPRRPGAGNVRRQEGRRDGGQDRAPAESLGSTVLHKSKERARAEAMALELAATPMKAVGLKMPEGLHDWLDDCQHRLKKQGVLKQDLLRRALQLLVIEVEAGETLADLEG